MVVWAALICFVSVAGIALAEDSVTGTVIQTDDGFMLQLEDGSLIQVDQDLSAMAGKRVKVTGTLQEGDNAKTIIASDIVEITE